MQKHISLTQFNLPWLHKSDSHAHILPAISLMTNTLTHCVHSSEVGNLATEQQEHRRANEVEHNDDVVIGVAQSVGSQEEGWETPIQSHATYQS